jgi:hypothetical protein
LFTAGCSDEQVLETDYGQRRGTAAKSVNGTSVLAEMFREAGGRPTSIVALSSSLDNYDVVIWAPDDFSMPREDVRAMLQQWLAAESGRTLVYVGRDYDAACDYWRAMIERAPASQTFEVMRRAAAARAAHSRARLDMPADECSPWFTMRRDFPGRHLKKLGGPWSADVEASQASLWSQGRLDIPSAAELTKLKQEDDSTAVGWEPVFTPLLTSGRQTLVFEVRNRGWQTSKMLVVANGSFLLNMPLVNHQHRLLAGKLIDACQPFTRVAFLESQFGGPVVLGGRKRMNEQARRMRVLLASHWLLLGAVVCLYLFPIFGRPKSLSTASGSDFGDHVEAMAALLERAGSTPYARRQLEIYRQGNRSDKHADRGATGSASLEPAGRNDDVFG